MSTKERVYRSRDALLGGVCSGAAEYFDVDPVVMRIVAVLATALTFGLGAFVYAVLWMSWPLAPQNADPVEVQPHAVSSETYGSVKLPSSSTSASAHLPFDSYSGAGHVPPEPPVAARHDPAYQGDAFAPRPPAAYTPSSQSVDPYTYSAGVKVAIMIGLVMLFLGAVGLMNDLVSGTTWFQFWPVALGIIGITFMVVPAKAGSRMNRFVGGLMLFCLSGSLLTMSLGVVSWETLGAIVANLWPVALLMLGCLVVGAATHSALLKFLGGLSFCFLCVVGTLWFAIPGPMEQVVLTFPFGREVSFPLEWLFAQSR